MPKISEILQDFNYEEDLVADAVQKEIMGEDAGEVARELFSDAQADASSKTLSYTLEDVPPEQQEAAIYAYLADFSDALRELSPALNLSIISDDAVWSEAWQQGLDFGNYLNATLDDTVQGLYEGLVAKLKGDMLARIASMIG